MEDRLLTECIRLWKISEDLQQEDGITEEARAYEIGYRCALNTCMEEVRPGIDWAGRVRHYRETGAIHVEY